jgi:hypothetical protein
MALPERFSTSFRLTRAAQDLIVRIASTLGIGRTAVVELAVRELAQTKKIKLEAKQ